MLKLAWFGLTFLVVYVVRFEMEPITRVVLCAVGTVLIVRLYRAQKRRANPSPTHVPAEAT